MRLLTILCSLFFSISICSQNANITFRADTTINIKLYGEIDNGVNRTNPIDTIQLVPNQAVCRQINIRDFSYLHIQYSSGIQCSLLVFPSNEITVYYSDNRLQISGDNQDGQLLLNKYFQTGLSAYTKGYSDSWDKYTNSDIDYKTLINAMQQDTVLLHERIGKLKVLAEEKKISWKFSDILTENICLFKQAYNIQSLRTLLLANKFKNRIKADSLTIANSIDSLFALFPNSHSQFIGRVNKQQNGGNYLTQYFFHHFGAERTNEDPHRFYNLSPYLHASKDVQSALIGRSLTANIVYGIGGHLKENCSRFIKYYPNSEYVSILKEYIKEPASDSEVNINSIDNISKLSDLVDIKQLKGKYVFVDLWATWCVPCRKEFEFRQPLDELVKSFKDITLIYISLDEGNNLQKWTGIAQKYGLEGIHIIAGKELQKDIRDKVFNGTKANVFLPTEFVLENNAVSGNSITIPRYFLLDKEGKVIHNDLPRPSNMKLLKDTLEKIFADI